MRETWRIYAAFMSGHRKIPLTCGYLVVAAAYERVKKCACVISLSKDGALTRTYIQALQCSFMTSILMLVTFVHYVYVM